MAAAAPVWLANKATGQTQSVWAVLFALIMAFCAFAPAPASAQTPAGQYVVSGVRVDVTGRNATEARAQALEQAPKLAWGRLAARLAADEASAQALPAPDGTALDAMVLSITVEDERRSTTRYVGRFAVSFRGDAVRAYFAGANITMIEQRGQALLVNPVMPSAPPAAQKQWRDAWEQGGYGVELRPVAVAPAGLAGAPDWTMVASAAANAAAPTAIFATATLSGATLTADLVEVGPNGFRRDRGRVTAAVRGSDVEDGMRRLADAANARLQAEHKAMVSTGAAPRAQRVTVSALYSGVAEWMRIKRGLDAAEDAMVRDVRIEAIHRDGALVSFTTLGATDQLTAELARHGVVMENGPAGAILRAPGPR
jgi:hypothetical protein